MKKILITFWFFVISILFVTAQDILNVNGQVTDIITNDGIPNHEVHIIIDSVFSGGSSYYNTVLTDNNGYYNDNIPLGGVTQGMVEIGTYDCVMFYHNYFGNFNPNNMNITADFSICNDSIPSGCLAYFYYVRDSIDYLTYHFFDQSFNPTGSATSWYWEFGDGVSSTEQNPSHTYQDEGAYNVCLTITDSTNNCNDTYCELLIIAGTGSGCENFFVYTTNDFLTFDFEGFLLNPNQPLANYEWDFGDGTSGTGQFVTHTFVQAGVAFYTVCLTTTTLDSITNDTCVYTSCQDVYIGNNNCQAGYYYYLDSMPLTYQFIDYSYGDPNSWLWDFGDGTTSTEQNPLHAFPQQGTYLVCLTIENDSTGCIDTFCDSVWAGNNGQWCFANFCYYPDSSNSLTQHFIDMSGTPVGGTPDTWFWDFGDGSTSTEQNPVYTYAGTGHYTVCLTITDSLNNCTDTYCEVIRVIEQGDCLADFIAFPAGAALTYQFLDISVGYPTNWNWDFGDGGTSTEQNPTHTFPQQGMYLVCLTIENDSTGCLDTFCDSLYIENFPGDCVSYFDYTVQNLTVDFNGYTYSIFPTTYTWDFGDGNTGTGQNVTHTYSDAGYYFVSLFTEDSIGCIFESMQNILVGDSSNFSNLYGTIFAGNNLADYGFVWLMSGDSLGFNAYFDFAEIDSAGMYNFYNVPPGDYYVQAMLSWQSAYFNDYMPTYYGDVLYWEDATVIQLGDPQNPYDINLIEAIFYNAGTGEINGTVTNEQGRGEVSDIEILLLSETYEPLSYINTDDEGNFDFSTLGYGTYVVYLELLGIETTPAVITISEENPSASIEIILKDGEATLSIEEPVSGYISDVSEVYPNPITSSANVEISLTKSSEIHLSIFNQMGQMVYQLSETKSSGSHIIPVKTDNLQNGFYTLQIQTTDGAKVVKKFVKIN